MLASCQTWRIVIPTDETRSPPDQEEALDQASALIGTDPQRAFELAQAAAIEGSDPRAFRIAAAALRALGRETEAEQAEMQAVRHGFTMPLRQARSAQQMRRSAEAAAIAEDYLRLNPDDLLAMTIAAEAMAGLGRSSEAEPILRNVIERAPSFPPANMLLATALASDLRLREAAQVLERLIERSPQEFNAKRFLADIKAQSNDPQSAASLYKQVIAAQPGNPADLFKYAQNLRAAGRKPESVKALRQSIELAPLGGHAWSTLARYFPEEITEADERSIEAAMANPATPDPDRRLLQGALAKLYDHRRNHEKAFAAIVAAKTPVGPGSEYQPEELTRHVDELIAGYTPELFERFKAAGSTSDAPIFVLGLPRSGSTLIERILGRHSKIEALGEIPVMPQLVGAQQPDGSARYRSIPASGLTGEKIAEMAEWYLDRAREFGRDGKPRFTDKYNGNWIRSGLIRLILPKAKIIDVRRDPLDCCWSVFKNFFADDYAASQDYLARYYADYVRFMAATDAASPGGILTVSYEAVVDDIAGETTRILDFLGLEFEQACVDFHLSTAPVTTPSSEQVRRPINREGIGSAEPYRPWLQPLIEGLDAVTPKTA